MKYTNSVIDKTNEELKRRREQAELTCRQHLEEIRVNEPEIYEKEMSIRNTCTRLSAVIFGGSGDPVQRVKEIEKQNEAENARLRDMLTAKGYPGDYLNINYTCKKCSDNGTKDGRVCECRKELLKRFSSQELSHGSSIALHSFDEVRFDLYKDPALMKTMQGMVEFLKRYCEGFSSKGGSRSLYMFGNTGTGKTFFSACIARAVMEKGMSVTFGSAFDLFMKLEDEHFGRSEGRTMQTMIESDLLIIDDLGTEFKKPFNESQLFNIINSRINLSRPTVISSNLSSDELTKRYDTRISSRILGIYVPVRFTGEDLRMKLNKLGNS